MDPIIVTAVAVVAGNVVSLLALWLRLRSRIQWEHTRGCYLIVLAQALPEGGQVCERRADGSHFAVARPGCHHDRGRSSGSGGQFKDLSRG